jgi:hypothetical protein
VKVGAVALNNNAACILHVSATTARPSDSTKSINASAVLRFRARLGAVFLHPLNGLSRTYNVQRTTCHVSRCMSPRC